MCTNYIHTWLSELNKTWYVSSTCGFMKLDKITYPCVVWLPCKGQLKIYPRTYVYYTGYCSIPCNFPIIYSFQK